MRITESQLRNIIKKELKMILMEINLKGDKPPYGLTDAQLSKAMQMVTSKKNIRFRDEPGDMYDTQPLYPSTLPAAIAEAVHGSDQELAQSNVESIRQFLDQLTSDPREPSAKVPKGKLLVDYYYQKLATQKAQATSPQAGQTRTDRLVGRLMGKEFVNK